MTKQSSPTYSLGFLSAGMVENLYLTAEIIGSNHPLEAPQANNQQQASTGLGSGRSGNARSHIVESRHPVSLGIPRDARKQFPDDETDDGEDAWKD